MLSNLSASNDGRQVVVLRKIYRPNVYITDLLPGSPIPQLLNIRRLTFSEADDYPHSWTADRRMIIFESNRNGNFQLFRQSVDQTDAEPLVLTTGDSMLEQLSPDGKWVLYRWDQGRGNRRLMRVDLGGGGAPEPVPIRGELDEFRCALQAGSRCVLRSVENEQFVFHELDSIRGEGRELARTAWSPTVLDDWDVSPDGSEVAIPNHDPHGAKIRLVPLTGRTPEMEEETITLRGAKFLNEVVWTADGRGWYAALRTTSGGLLLYVGVTGIG